MERFANEASAQLDGAIDASQASIIVKSAVRTPASGTFRARVDDEIFKVTNVSGSTWTVDRGSEGSTAAAHNDSAPIHVIITAEAIDAIVSVQQDGAEVSNRRTISFTGATVSDDPINGRVNVAISAGNEFGEVIVPPVLANFTFDGHSIAGTPTATTQGSDIVLYHPGRTSDGAIELFMAAPATPYQVIAKLSLTTLSWGGVAGGIYFGDSTKLQTVGVQLNNNSVVQQRWIAWNAISLTPFSTGQPVSGRIRWFRLTDNGTTKTYSVSGDGRNWIQIYAASSTEYLTGGTTRIGVALNGNTGGNNNGRTAFLTLQSWEVT